MARGAALRVTTVTLASVPDDTLFAVTVIDFALVLAGAVNKPLAEMLPALADQVTAVLLVLLNVAANCTFPPGATEGSAGEIRTVTHLAQDSTVTVYARAPEAAKGSPEAATRPPEVPKGSSQAATRTPKAPKGSPVTEIVNVKLPA